MSICTSPVGRIKYLLVVCMILILNGCTTLEPVDLTPDQLQEQVREGKLFQPGEIVSIVTPEREYHDILITAVTEKNVSYEETILTEGGAVDENTFESEQAVKSNTVDIPINKIVKITRREPTVVGYAVGITAGATVGWLVVALPVAIICAIAL